MTVSSINGSQSVFQSQNITNRQNPDRDGDNDGSGNRVKSSGGRHQVGGAFMQDVIQSLQSIGLNFPGQTVNPASSTNTSGGNIQSNTTIATTDPRQALHQLMHDLRQALHQMGSQQTTATDSDGDNDNSGANSAAQSNGYNNFGTNLQSLITMLGNGSSNVSGTGSANGVTDKLQSDFSNLVQSLNNGNASTSGATTPNLQDFLTNLENSLGNKGGVQSNPGSLFHISA